MAAPWLLSNYFFFFYYNSTNFTSSTNFNSKFGGRQEWRWTAVRAEGEKTEATEGSGRAGGPQSAARRSGTAARALLSSADMAAAVPRPICTLPASREARTAPAGGAGGAGGAGAPARVPGGECVRRQRSGGVLADACGPWQHQLKVPMRIREDGREERSAPVLVAVQIEADAQSSTPRNLMCFQVSVCRQFCVAARARGAGLGGHRSCGPAGCETCVCTGAHAAAC